MNRLRPQWVLFGDSITQRAFSPGGWAGLLADAYQRKVDVVNRGYSGYNTRWAVQLLPHLFPEGAPPPQLATVFFGANDAALPDRPSAKQHVPLSEYTDNVRTIVNHLRSMGTEAILLVTPPPISEPNRLAWILETYGVELPAPERTNETAGQYAAACSALAQDLNVPVVNLWEAFQKVDDWADELLCDGLHLTAKGNAVVGEMVLQQVETSFPELAPDVMKWDVPEWTLLAEAEDAGQEVTAHLAKAEKA